MIYFPLIKWRVHFGFFSLAVTLRWFWWSANFFLQTFKLLHSLHRSLSFMCPFSQLFFASCSKIDQFILRFLSAKSGWRLPSFLLFNFLCFSSSNFLLVSSVASVSRDKRSVSDRPFSTGVSFFALVLPLSFFIPLHFLLSGLFRFY